MPRSHFKVNRWRTLCALLAFVAFVSLMLAEVGAQGTKTRGRSQLQQNTVAAAARQQARRKNIASVRSFDTSDGSRVSITSDVPLNDYAAFWSGDRYYVVIPDAELIMRDSQTLQSSLRGQGFQDVRIEKKGGDVVISFRLRAGMRARVEQKFNRLDVLFTAPNGAVFNPTQNRNTAPIFPRGTGGQQSNVSGTSSTGTTIGSTGTSGGTTTASSTGGGAGRSRGRGMNARGGSRGYNYGYSGGGGDRGGGAPLNIPLPSAEQPEATPEASVTATPSASPATGEAPAETSATPLATASPTPAEQIAQNEPQQPVTAPPSTSTTTTTTTAPSASAATDTSFAAAVKDNWLPLLIGLLVLLAIGLLLVSRSRAEGGEEGRTERIETKKRESIKESPTTRTGAKLAGGLAGAAVARESRREAPPAKERTSEEVKGIEPAAAPPVAMEKVSSETKALLEGKDYDESVIGSSNPETRQIVSTELMAALASRNPDRQLRAREAFTKHGFFDEATRRLRTAEAPAERISAARALGLTQDKGATPHLSAALEDDDPEVRRAAVNALAELRDPSAIGPLNALLEREKNRKVPHSLIRRAIESSATIDVQQPSTASAATPAAETRDAAAPTAEKKDKDDDDREVFEI